MESLFNTVPYHLLSYLQPTTIIGEYDFTNASGCSKLKKKTSTDNVKIVQTESRSTEIYRGNNGGKDLNRFITSG